MKRCKGEIGHDERVFGCMEFGVGAARAEAPAPSDGIVPEHSVWADEVQLEEEGRYVHPDLAALARELGVAGYWDLLTRIGASAPLHGAAVGKVLSAHSSPEDVQQYVEGTGLSAYTRHAITVSYASTEPVEGIKADGFAINEEER